MVKHSGRNASDEKGLQDLDRFKVLKHNLKPAKPHFWPLLQNILFPAEPVLN